MPVPVALAIMFLILLSNKLLYFFLYPLFLVNWLFLQVDLVTDNQSYNKNKNREKLYDTCYAALFSLNLNHGLTNRFFWCSIIKVLMLRKFGDSHLLWPVHYKIYNLFYKNNVSYRIRTCAGKPIWFRIKLLNHSDKLTFITFLINYLKTPWKSCSTKHK